MLDGKIYAFLDIIACEGSCLSVKKTEECVSSVKILSYQR